MPVLANRRSVMTLHSDPGNPYCHQVRIVLAEKEVSVAIVDVNTHYKHEDLFALNPYGSLPTLVDRDLVLYNSQIIMEYLDERFPYPPLLPVSPVARAECRRMIYRIKQDWYGHMDKISHGPEEEALRARQEITDTLMNLVPAFVSKHYFLSDEFTLVDCWLAPLLWRLPKLTIELPIAAKPIKEYAKRIFDRASFQASLSELEREIWN
jgi:RNA polymerase-associated protein